MIDIKKTVRGGETGVDVNMSPLIDMVFLLLIFFVVTTSFVKEAGIEVSRSTASTAEIQEQATVMIGVTDAGEVFIEGKKVDFRSVRGLVERMLVEHPDAGVIVIADKGSRTGDVVRVMDQCRLADAKSVSLAARREGEP